MTSAHLNHQKRPRAHYACKVTALAIDKVGFVGQPIGQPIAVVVAESPSIAQDAVDLITMDVEPLAVVVDPKQAAQPGAPKIHDDFDDNVMFHLYGPAHPPSLTPLGLTDELFRQADKVVSLKITQQRLVPMSMEPRGVLATFDRGRGKLTVWLSTQIPHLVRTTYGDGAIYVTADPSRRKTLVEVAFAATDFNWQPQGGVLAGLEPGLEAISRFERTNGTFPFGTHICVVEVERETGQVELKRYVTVDDCGHVINPPIVDGQVHSGIAQGLAQALYEEVVYDAYGQLVTGSLMDYAVPKAHMLPPFETDRTVTPTPVNPLGAKGIGEAGTIGSAPAVVNAIVDALAPFGVMHLEMPVKPETLWRLMNQCPQGSGDGELHSPDLPIPQPISMVYDDES